MAVRVLRRRGSVWTSKNPVLRVEDIGIDTTGTPRIKVGDGVTHWNDLPYVTTESDSSNQVPYVGSMYVHADAIGVGFSNGWGFDPSTVDTHGDPTGLSIDPDNLGRILVAESGLYVISVEFSLNTVDAGEGFVQLNYDEAASGTYLRDSTNQRHYYAPAGLSAGESSHRHVDFPPVYLDADITHWIAVAASTPTGGEFVFDNNTYVFITRLG